MTSDKVLRGHIQISGTDSTKFLQSLVTNDIQKLNTEPYIHACLLTPQGKFLHDFFITKDNVSYHLNCEAHDRCDDLYKRLQQYRLRAAVDIWKLDDRDSILTPYGYSFFDTNCALSRDDWEMQRLKQARGDGSRDAIIGSSTLDELNLVSTTVSFDKGCYVGQELTTRLNLRGLGKKHLYPFECTSDNVPFPETLGEERSRHGRYGLALIRDEIATDLPKSKLDFILIS